MHYKRKMRLRYVERARPGVRLRGGGEGIVVTGSSFAIYRMCNREPKSFQGGVIYDTLCKGRFNDGAPRAAVARTLNECLSLLPKLKCTSMTVYLRARAVLLHGFLLLQRTLLCAASVERRRNESGYNAGIN